MKKLLIGILVVGLLFGGLVVWARSNPMQALDLIAWFENIGDPHLKQCEALLEDSLVSPSSLDIIERDVYALEDHKSIYLKFDAQNRMGAVLRMTANCNYPVDPATLLGEDPTPAYKSKPDAMTINGKPVENLDLKVLLLDD
ncbi:hypothetical protein [Thioalbus denitrificans]|uniref:Uncharacterized protein n=1 Tax=Thioalbus denitrificans TaxID=547122 RepID=A0A369CHD5_9GAMM|nr:hypothetical protein [Thioalbus denitrificans]RCX32096.1 hypothetical protein DFQ59_102449 [Thioalbus denitrificans]